MGPDLIHALIVAAAVLAAFNIARKTLDLIARKRHWRVGARWGPVLCIWRRTGGGCFRCDTDYRWALPHDIPLREDGYGIFPLCQKCWQETGIPERLLACEALMRDWQRQGRYDGPEGRQRWDDERTLIYMAVKAGL